MLKSTVQSISKIFKSGGAEEDRTLDPLLAKQVLSQLSYSPVKFFAGAQVNMVGPRGIEPLTSSLSGTRSNQLSYGPKVSGKLPLTLQKYIKKAKHFEEKKLT